MKDVRKAAQDIQERVREMAYYMWEAAGRQQGIATEYWLAAEREVLTTMKTTAEKLMPSAKFKAQVESAIAETWTKPEPKKEPTTAPSAKKAQAPAQKSAPAATAAKKPEPASKSAAQPKPAAKVVAEKPAEGIETIEGIGPAYKTKLAKAGIHTPAELLEKGGSAAGRKSIVAGTGISNKRILKWVNMADLMRIPGVTGQFAELLEAAGVDTVKELRNRNGDNLASTMKDVNAAKNLTPSVPSAKDVTGWIEKAKKLDPKVTH